uniref:Minor tail protein n=1 Tax=Vibrio phage Vc1 TaxID=1480731 RepID=A0A6M5CAT3_9CAUD
MANNAGDLGLFIVKQNSITMTPISSTVQEVKATFREQFTSAGVPPITRGLHSENVKYTPEELLEAQSTGVLPPKDIAFRGKVFGARPLAFQGSALLVTVKQKTKADIIESGIRSYNGMMQAKVTIWVTATSLMDDSGNVADGAYRKLIYYVERPSPVNKTIAEFELTSPYDMDGIMIPARVTQSVCYWAQRNWYRSGKGCGYNGNRMFDKDNKPVSDPSLDYCAGTVTACKLRFGENNPLDFGGAAVASLVRRNQ